MVATEDPDCAGNWNVRARVGVFGNPDADDDAATPRADFNADAAIVSDKLMQTDIGSELSAAVSGLQVYDPPVTRRKVPDIERRTWVKWFEIELYCLCRDV